MILESEVEYRKAKVQAFAQKMEEVFCLPKNMAKGNNWASLDNRTLFDMFNEELKEFEEAIKEGNPNHVHHEAADVAIVALMICDKMKEL